MIRHRLDYGNIILVDERYSYNNSLSLSKWIMPYLKTYNNYSILFTIELDQFINDLTTFWDLIPPECKQYKATELIETDDIESSGDFNKRTPEKKLKRNLIEMYMKESQESQQVDVDMKEYSSLLNTKVNEKLLNLSKMLNSNNSCLTSNNNISIFNGVKKPSTLENSLMHKRRCIENNLNSNTVIDLDSEPSKLEMVKVHKEPLHLITPEISLMFFRNELGSRFSDFETELSKLESFSRKTKLEGLSNILKLFQYQRRRRELQDQFLIYLPPDLKMLMQMKLSQNSSNPSKDKKENISFQKNINCFFKPESVQQNVELTETKCDDVIDIFEEKELVVSSDKVNKCMFCTKLTLLYKYKCDDRLCRE